MKNFIFFTFILLKLCVFSQDFSHDFGYVGLSFNKYSYGLTPFEIYAYDINHLSSNTNQYKGLGYAPGFVFGNTIGENSVKGKIELSYNRKVSKASYSMINIQDSSIFEVDEKLKLTYGVVKVGVYYSPKNFNRFSIGGTLDIGIFKNNIKRKGGNFSGNWEKFMTQTGLTNDYSNRQVTAGVGIYASLLLTENLLFTISRQFTMLDAEYNTKNLKDFSVNTQHIQFSLAYAFF